MIGWSVLTGQGARVTFKIFNNLASCIPITISSACQEELSLSPSLPISISLPLSPLLLCSLPPSHHPHFFFSTTKYMFVPKNLNKIEMNKIKYENPFPPYLLTNPNPNVSIVEFISFHNFFYIFSNKSICELSGFTHFLRAYGSTLFCIFLFSLNIS